MKRLHRSLLFWLALLPGLFLLGAWMDSFVQHTWITSYPLGRQVALWHYDGIVSLRFTKSRVTGVDSIIVREKAYFPDDRKLLDIFFPQPSYETNVKPGIGDQYRLLLPHWLLIATWLILFLGMLVVRRKLQRKHRELAVEAPASPTE